METEASQFTLNDSYALIGCSIVLLFLMFIIPSVYTGTNYTRALVSLTQFNSTGYPYLNPPIFFSIGEALSAVTILLAIYQFKKENWNIILKIRNYVKPVIILSISTGIICAILASYFSFVTPTNIFQLSIFWQITSSILICFSILFLYINATNRHLFTRASAKRFFEVLFNELARSTSNNSLVPILDVILFNFDAICKTVSSYDKSLVEPRKYAHAIINQILSDESVVQELTTKRLDALQYIISVIKKYNIDESLSPVGFPRLMQNLFYNQESFLYKQLDRNGLAISSNIYDSLFGSPALLSNFKMYGYPVLDYSMRKNLNNTGITVFIKSLSKSIETYLKSGKVPARAINEGLEYLSDIFGDICTKIGIEEDRGVHTKYSLKEEWWTLHQIARFLGHDYLFLAYKDNKELAKQEILSMERTSREADFHSSETINSGIAAAIYKSFEEISCIKKTDDIYHTILDLLHGMLHERSQKEGYQDPFEKRMWEQIRKNVAGKRYPNVLRPYLTFVGFLLASERERSGWAGAEKERVRKLLYIDLKPLLEKNEKMVDSVPMQEALLPETMNYKDGKFTYTFKYGEGTTVIIDEPPTGAKSALDEDGPNGESRPRS